METTMAAIQRYWGSEHEYSDDELFAIAKQQWEIDDGVKDFVLQVVACGLEEKPFAWLLQFHATDAANGLQKLVTACSDPYFITGEVQPLVPTLGMLLMATVLRAAACDSRADNRKRRLDGVVEMMKTKGAVESKAWWVIRELIKCDANEDAGVWTQFLELPHVLDSRVFNSRSGRTFMDEVGQIIALQQLEVKAVHVSTEERDNRELNDMGKDAVADALWDLAEQLVTLSLRADTDADEQDTAAAEHSTPDCTLNTVKCTADFEEYLTANESIPEPRANCAVAHHEEFDDSDEPISAIKELSSICLSVTSEASSISSELLERAFEELSVVKNPHVLAIHASFVLGLQIKSNVCFVDRCESVKEDLERRIRRVFNRLTGKAKDLDHTDSLVILSAFCPEQVVQHLIHDARIDSLHHALYLNVLRSSPLLVDWNEGPGNGAETLIDRELQQTLRDISSNQNSFDRESQNDVSFLLSLVGVSTSKRDPGVMTITKFINRVLIPVCTTMDHKSSSPQSMLNLYSLVQQLFDKFVASSAELEIDSTALQSLFNHVTMSLCFPGCSDLALGVHLREKLLLLLKNILELPNFEPTIMFEQLDSPFIPAIWTLISMFDVDISNEGLCEGLKDVTAVEAYMQKKECLGADLPPLPLTSVISAVQVLLWGLLWDSTLSGSVSLESTKDETWSLLDHIAGHEFSEFVDQSVKGSLLIQSAVAEMMLECGGVLFELLYKNIIPYLLQYEPINAQPIEEEWLSLPEWTAGKLPEKMELERRISCQLVSTHSIMRYVANCRGLSRAVNSQLVTTSNVLLVGSFGHVLAVLDQGVTSSQRSLSATLFCIQWLCFLVSASYELHLDAASTWPTVRTQVELSLLRLLHQLDQLKGTSTAEARFSQCFVAGWLAYLPVGQFQQVFNFLATRRNE